MKQNISERIGDGNGILIFDGAMGTALQRAGMKPGERSEIFGALHPEIVEAVHARYVDAGCDILTANSFGVSGFALENCAARIAAVGADGGFAGETAVRGAGETAARTGADISVAGAVNAAVRAAQNAASAAASAGRDIYVALDIGPAGKILNLMDGYDDDTAYHIFREQIEAGTAAGVDLILFETFSDPAEMAIALRAARDVTGERTDGESYKSEHGGAREGAAPPVFCSFTFMDGGRTYMGASAEDAVRAAEQGGAAAVGVNCSFGPAETLPIVKQMLALASIPVFAQPNAGLPELRDGAACYDLPPETFADVIMQAADAGAAALGGCCGTDERFIRALRERVGA